MNFGIEDSDYPPEDFDDFNLASYNLDEDDEYPEDREEEKEEGEE